MALVAPGDEAPHGSVDIARRRLPVAVFRAVNKLVLGILKEAGLLRGRALALDASTMDANAAMRSIVRKDTNESYDPETGSRDLDNEPFGTSPYD